MILFFGLLMCTHAHRMNTSWVSLLGVASATCLFPVVCFDFLQLVKYGTKENAIPVCSPSDEVKNQTQKKHNRP